MVNYSDLGLKNASSPKTIKIGETEVKVLQYLPAADKYNFIVTTAQEALENGVINPFKLDLFFHLNLIIMYTDITFEDANEDDLLTIYDALVTNDVINLVVAAMNEDEYNILFTMTGELSEALAEKNNSIVSMMESFSENIPDILNTIQDTIKNIDPKQMQDMANNLIKISKD